MRRASTWVASACLGLLVGGGSSCSNEPDAFRCGSSDQCSGGICQPTGYCSFPDPTCPSSSQRYGNLAGEGLANTCVIVDSADDSSNDASESSDSDSLGETTNSGSTTGAESSTGSMSSTAGSQTDSTSSSTSMSSTSSTSGTSTGKPDSSTSMAAAEDSDSTTGGDSTTAAETSMGTTEGGSSETSTEPVLSCIPDEFDTGTVPNSSRWSVGGELPRANAVVADGQLQLTVDPTLEGSNNVVVSTRTANRYNGSAELEFGTVDTSAYGGVQLVFGMGSGDQFIEFQRIGFDVVARYRVDDTSPEELWREEYSPSLHRFVALRVEGTSDDATLIWETSGNGTSWDTRYSLPRPVDQLDMSAALVQILAGTFEASEDVIELAPFTIERYEQCLLIH